MIFKLFGKVNHSSESVNPTGIGLGLAICNHILNQYGSQMKVASEVNRGSRFFFTMKMKEVQDTTIILDDHEKPVNTHSSCLDESSVHM